MKYRFQKSLIFLFFCFLTHDVFPQLALQPDDPPKSNDIPGFYKTKLDDIYGEIEALRIGKAEVIAVSPGRFPVHAVYYGKKDDFNSTANYNSAVGAGNPAHYAKKTAETKPVVFFIGPVHGHEVEGIVGLVNLMHIAETGKDYRGKEWHELRQYFNQCRVVIIPCGNPDGRKRIPYDSFVGLPQETMTKYGQGTKKDGTLWRWPAVKAMHPMKGDVDILGAYFNDKGINIMHDEFFSPMAEETRAIMKIAIEEAPDITVSLHSCSCKPFIIQNSHAPHFMKKRIADLAQQVNQSYIKRGLPNMGNDWALSLTIDDMLPPAQKSFNLVSALHYASGTMAFTFESPHGLIEDGANYDEILDIQLVLYEEMFRYITLNRLLGD